MTALIAAWVICGIGVALWLLNRYHHAPIEDTRTEGTDEQWAALLTAVEELYDFEQWERQVAS